jgi:hypothetical protein
MLSIRQLTSVLQETGFHEGPIVLVEDGKEVELSPFVTIGWKTGKWDGGDMYLVLHKADVFPREE